MNETEKKKEPDRSFELDATPEEVVKAMFSNVKPPDPSLRRKGKEKQDDQETSEGG